MANTVESLLTLLCLSMLSFTVLGQHKHPLTDIPASGEVQTTYVLPDHPSKQFPAGEQIPILVGFRNAASRGYNVSFILGSINLPENNMFIQNFSYYAYFAFVPPQEEATFEYSFRPDKSLRAMELRVALTVFYGDQDGTGYASTFFNESIDIVEKPTLIDYEILWMWIVMLAIAGAAVYGLVAWLMGLTAGKKGPTKRAPKKTTDESGKEDWLAGTPASRYAKQK